MVLPLTLSGGDAVTCGSREFLQTYFGVNAADSARSGLQRYDADSPVVAGRGDRDPFMVGAGVACAW